jgi:hypothetical protein
MTANGTAVVWAVGVVGVRIAVELERVCAPEAKLNEARPIKIPENADGRLPVLRAITVKERCEATDCVGYIGARTSANVHEAPD